MSPLYIFPVLIGICVDLLVFTLCYWINYSAKVNHGLNMLTFLGLAAFAIFILYYFILQCFPQQSRSFYVIFYPLFLSACSGLSISYDIWHRPNYLAFSEYFKINDIIVHSLWGDVMTVIDGTIMKSIHLLILYRAWNGLSFRSLLIFNATCMDTWFVVFSLMMMSLNCELQMVSKIFIPALPFVYVSPLLVILWNKRNFTFDSKQPSPGVKTMDKLNAAGIALSIIIFTVKFLTAIGSTMWPTDLIRSHDPMVLYLDAKMVDLTPRGFGVLMTWITMALIVPSLPINLYYKFQPQKPLFLWDLAIAQAGIILMFQLHYILGALAPATPPAFRADVGNEAFWIINGIPLVVAALEIFALHKHRVKSTDFNGSFQKLSKHSNKKLQ